MLLWAKQSAVIGFIAQHTGILMLISVPVKEYQNISEDAVLEELLRDNLCKTQRELPSVFWATRQALSRRFHMFGVILPRGTLVLYDFKSERLSVVIHLWTTGPADKKEMDFLFGSKSAMEVGFITAIQRKRDHWDCPVMHFRRQIGRMFTLQKIRCASDGTRVALFILGCWTCTKQLLWNGIELNWCDWAEPCGKRCFNTSRGRTTNSTVWQRLDSHFQTR